MSNGKLPIWPLRKEIESMVRNNRAVILVGETGSGKSTQLPRFLHDTGVTNSGGIFCSQPRRLPAVTVAQRVADELGVQLGKQVGYSVRFEDMTHASTQIKYATDGFLLRETTSNPLLPKYTIAIVDEAHERSMQTEILLGILKNISTQRPDSMRIIIMSATLNINKFSNYFGSAPYFCVHGRQYPVQILYKHACENKDDLFTETINTVIEIHLGEPPGDILVFLAGQEEIESVENHLKKRLRKSELSSKICSKSIDYELLPKRTHVISGLVIVTIFSSLPPDMQMRAFNPPPKGYRKVILATNIAETSVTINGIRYVIDPGLVKRRSYSAKIACDMITTVSISQAQSRQRAGRAGRETSGSCFRLYSEEDFLRLKRTSSREVSKENLISVALQLKRMGVLNVLNFDFLDPPPLTILTRSLELLLKLGAVDHDGNITTEIGYKMSSLPVEPMLAKTMLVSGTLQCSKEALLVASLISTNDGFLDSTKRNKVIKTRHASYLSKESDHITILNICRAFMTIPPKEQIKFCRDHFLNPRFFQKAHSIHRQLVDHFKRLSIPLLSCGTNTTALRQALAVGFSPHVALRRPNGQYMVMASGHLVELYPSPTRNSSNPLPSAGYVIFGEQLLTSRHYIKDITVVEKTWLSKI